MGVDWVGGADAPVVAEKIMLLYLWTSHLLLIKIHKFSLAN